MHQTLPQKTQELIHSYLNIKIGNKVFNCPYYQNMGKIRKEAVFIGKGLPNEIEAETSKMLKKSNLMDTFSIKLYMVMAGLGIDCSGLAVRILDVFFKETKNISITNVLKPLDSSPAGRIRYSLKPYTNISANMLTSPLNTTIISEYNQVVPGDMIRFGKSHVAVIIEVNLNKIIYIHSTSDYQDQFGVKIGNIFITNPKLSLEKQKWDEGYHGKNWTLQDYLNSPEDDRGIRRLL